MPTCSIAGAYDPPPEQNDLWLQNSKRPPPEGQQPRPRAPRKEQPPRADQGNGKLQQPVRARAPIGSRLHRDLGPRSPAKTRNTVFRRARNLEPESNLNTSSKQVRVDENMTPVRVTPAVVPQVSMVSRVAPHNQRSRVQEANSAPSSPGARCPGPRRDRVSSCLRSNASS